MDILLAFIFGGAVGAALHVLMPGRDSRGMVLAPVIGALMGGVTWLIFTWAGVTTASPWIWLISVLAPLLVVPITLLALTRARASHDAREQVRLKIS